MAVAAGLRSGGRGGPLALQPADVQLVLLAPLPRSVALRRPAADHLRFGAVAGGAAGMVGGNLAAQRLPGSYGSWVFWGGLAGLVTGLAWTGSALPASASAGGGRARSAPAALGPRRLRGPASVANGGCRARRTRVPGAATQCR